jgi:hypothetical protein
VPDLKVMLNPALIGQGPAQGGGKTFPHGEPVTVRRDLWNDLLKDWKTPYHGRRVRTLIVVTEDPPAE